MARRAIVIVVVAALGAACGAAGRLDSAHRAGFWFNRDAFALTPSLVKRLGGPVSVSESQRVEQLARAEVQRAFDGLPLRVTADASAFWRVEVQRTLRVRPKQPLPHAGESLALGALGGRGAVNLELVAIDALHYAPPGASRRAILDAIGRGAGRVAVHEFAHQILAPAGVHDDEDVDSYEYPSPDRASQYYGTLHWTIARPLLERRLR